MTMTGLWQYLRDTDIIISEEEGQIDIGLESDMLRELSRHSMAERKSVQCRNSDMCDPNPNPGNQIIHTEQKGD